MQTPLFRRLTEIIKQYEELTSSELFQRYDPCLLRQPGKEYTLFREETGRWNFKPVAFQKHKVAGPGHPSAKWIVNNEFDNSAC